MEERRGAKKEILERAKPSQRLCDTDERQLVPSEFAYDDEDLGAAKSFDLAQIPTLLIDLCYEANNATDHAKNTKTYNRRDSQMVTHSSTSRPVQCLCMAERTGCPVLTDLWSYVLIHFAH